MHLLVWPALWYLFLPVCLATAWPGSDAGPRRPGVPRSTRQAVGMVSSMVLAQRKVLILAADDFEDSELLYPLYRLREEDVAVTVAGLDDHPVRGKKGYGPLPVDATVSQVTAGDFDALVIPGGYAPDKLRR